MIPNEALALPLNLPTARMRLPDCKMASFALVATGESRPATRKTARSVPGSRPTSSAFRTDPLELVT